jgi:TRAP-type mannitol/chloroaromatic compound transport system substrate-binding protein
MFKKLAQKLKSVLFKAQKLDANSPIAKAQAKLIDDLAAQAEVVAEVAKNAADGIVASAKKEVEEAVKEVKAKKPTAKKAAPSNKPGRPKKTTK